MKAIWRWVTGVVVVGGIAVSGAHARTWKQLQLGQITVISDASNGEIHDAATDLTDVCYVLDHIIIEDPSWRKPLVVVYFADQTQLQPLLPEVAPGKTIDDVDQEREVWTVREAASAPDWFAVAASASLDNSRASKFAASGGAVDWYLDALDYRIPVAIRRGFNQVMSTFYRQSEHGVLGQPIPGFIRILDHWPMIPVRTLLAESNYRHVINEGQRVTFQAESWGLVHYLMFGKGNQPGHAFRLFMKALSQHQTPDQALIAAVGPADAARIDFLLRAYLRNVVYAVRMPMPPHTENADPIVPADTATVEMALAKAALVGRRESALSHANAAVAAAPGDPRPLALKAEVLAGLSRPAADVRQAVDAASAAGSQDPWIVYRTATHRLLSAQTGLPPQEARAIIRLAEHSANANHNYHPIFDLIARCLWQCPPRANDSTFLNFAADRFPSDRWILVGQAAIARAHGDQAGSARLLEQAQSADPALSAAQLDDIRTFLAGLKQPLS